MWKESSIGQGLRSRESALWFGNFTSFTLEAPGRVAERKGEKGKEETHLASHCFPVVKTVTRN